MSLGLSILLPTYNCLCINLVEALHRQCEPQGIPYEILVADDGSPDTSFIKRNQVIEQFSHVRYIRQQLNIGRAAIRNLLAREAQYSWLIFIDGDLTLNNPHFITRYIDEVYDAHKAPQSGVIVGGITIGGDPEKWHSNLRYRYEKHCEAAHRASSRAAKRHQEFRTTNFMIHRKVILAYPFDEGFFHYGYEDVFFGKTLCDNGIDIRHIDNPITLDDFEDNPTFVAKNEEALRTLFKFREQLMGYSTILAWHRRLKALRLLPIVKLFYKTAGNAIKSNLQHNNPQVFLFNIYKVLYYSSLKNKSS